MKENTDDGMKIQTIDRITITDSETGEVIEKRNGTKKQEMNKNEEG